MKCINWGDTSLPARFWSSVAPCPMSGCWLWTGPVNHRDYGKTVLNGKHISSHRKAWIVLVGPIAAGLQIDHLCKNTRCCNPAHLEPVTPRENTLRGTSIVAVNARKTHCKQGHELSGDNLFYQKGGRERQCKLCQRTRGTHNARRKRHRLRDERLANHDENRETE